MNVKNKKNKAKALKYDWTLHLNNHSWYAIALNFIGKRGKTNFISCSWWNFLVFISSHRWPVVVCSEGCFVYLTPCDSSPLLLHIRVEQQQGVLIQQPTPDWSEWDSEDNLLLWETDLCAASLLSVVLATWGTGGRFEGSLEELS